MKNEDGTHSHNDSPKFNTDAELQSFLLANGVVKADVTPRTKDERYAEFQEFVARMQGKN